VNNNSRLISRIDLAPEVTKDPSNSVVEISPSKTEGAIALKIMTITDHRLTVTIDSKETRPEVDLTIEATTIEMIVEAVNVEKKTLNHGPTDTDMMRDLSMTMLKLPRILSFLKSLPRLIDLSSQVKKHLQKIWKNLKAKLDTNATKSVTSLKRRMKLLKVVRSVTLQ